MPWWRKAPATHEPEPKAERDDIDDRLDEADEALRTVRAQARESKQWGQIWREVRETNHFQEIWRNEGMGA